MRPVAIARALSAAPGDPPLRTAELHPRFDSRAAAMVAGLARVGVFSRRAQAEAAAEQLETAAAQVSLTGPGRAIWPPIRRRWTKTSDTQC